MNIFNMKKKELSEKRHQKQQQQQKQQSSITQKIWTIFENLKVPDQTYQSISDVVIVMFSYNFLKIFLLSFFV